MSVSLQVNVAIRSSLQSLREKIEQLREQLLRAVATRQMYLHSVGTEQNVLPSLVPSFPEQETLSAELSLCCWLLCSQQLQLRGAGAGPGSGHLCVTTRDRMGCATSELPWCCWCGSKVTCAALNWPGGIFSWHFLLAFSPGIFSWPGLARRKEEALFRLWPGLRCPDFDSLKKQQGCSFRLMSKCCKIRLGKKCQIFC